MDSSEVSAALEIVLEEIEAVVDELNQQGASAFGKGDYESAKGVIETATRVTDFRASVRGLQKAWETLLSGSPVTPRPTPAQSSTRRVTSRLQRGLRTPEDKFRPHVLSVLAELGGAGSVTQVLDKVGIRMAGVLNDYDRQPLPSNPNSLRWRNSAQWCRNTLVQEGLLKADSPIGTWELSDRGLAAVRSQPRST